MLIFLPRLHSIFYYYWELYRVYIHIHFPMFIFLLIYKQAYYRVYIDIYFTMFVLSPNFTSRLQPLRWHGHCPFTVLAEMEERAHGDTRKKWTEVELPAPTLEDRVHAGRRWMSLVYTYIKYKVWEDMYVVSYSWTRLADFYIIRRL